MILISTMAAMPFMIVVFPLIPKLVSKYGKRNVILITSAISFAFSMIKVVFYIENVLLFTILNILTLLGQTAFTMLIWALVSDCLDYSEWKTGMRSDGSMYSLYTFSRKIGSTVASTGIAASLGLVGSDGGKCVVVDWYYKKYGIDGAPILHYCKFAGDTVLFSTENEGEYPNGWYEHGKA